MYILFSVDDTDSISTIIIIVAVIVVVIVIILVGILILFASWKKIVASHQQSNDEPSDIMRLFTVMHGVCTYGYVGHKYIRTYVRSLSDIIPMLTINVIISFSILLYLCKWIKQVVMAFTIR